MKPTLANIRKMAAETADPKELDRLKDLVAFFLEGAKEAALELRKSINDVGSLLDRGRAVEDFIDRRSEELGL